MFLAIKNRLLSIPRRDLETDAEILACELRPDSRILAVVFYRPQDTDLEYLKQLKKTLLLASKAKFDQILLRGCPRKNRLLDFRSKTEFLQIFCVRQLVHMINENSNNLALSAIFNNYTVITTLKLSSFSSRERSHMQ